LGFAPVAGAGKLRVGENAGRAAADPSRSPGFFHSVVGGLVPVLSLLGGLVPALLAAGLTPRSSRGRGTGAGLRGAEKLAAGGTGSVISLGLVTTDSANSGKPPSRKKYVCASIDND
jgi:hypothetical protein